MSFWTDAQKSKAAKLWNDGWSARMIARQFGVSRSSVIGIAHRNRDLFPNKPKTEPRPRQARPEPQARPFVVRRPKPVRPGPPELPKPEAIEEKPDPDFVPSSPVTIFGLTGATCRWPLWPLGDNPGTAGLYCGEAVDEDSSWCRHHRMRASSRPAQAGQIDEVDLRLGGRSATPRDGRRAV